jgi:hypothetical protein
MESCPTQTLFPAKGCPAYRNSPVDGNRDPRFFWQMRIFEFAGNSRVCKPHPCVHFQPPNCSVQILHDLSLGSWLSLHSWYVVGMSWNEHGKYAPLLLCGSGCGTCGPVFRGWKILYGNDQGKRKYNATPARKEILATTCRFRVPNLETGISSEIQLGIASKNTVSKL